MQPRRLRKIILEAHNGTSIKSFNMLSGEKITPPDYKLETIDDDGLVIFSKIRSKDEGGGCIKIATEASYIESITFYPKNS